MLVIYSDAMIAPAQGASPSAAKQRPVVEAWSAMDPAIRIVAPKPASADELCAAHDQSFVEGVLALRIANGFGTRSSEVMCSLPYTNGAMLTAARLALETRSAVAAPVSGFHHACWNEAAAYCTFNGLIVTAMALRADHPHIRVGILDYDYRYGDGTDDIITHRELDFIVHYTAGRTYTHASQAEDFLKAVPGHVLSMANCDVVLYQAGADPHIDDPLGGFLATSELAERDRLVFQSLRDIDVPVAWNLAGGYQQPLSKVIAIHKNTYRACEAIHGSAHGNRPG